MNEIVNIAIQMKINHHICEEDHTTYSKAGAGVHKQ